MALHHTQKKSLIAKYSHLQGEELKQKLQLDELGLDNDAVEEVYSAIAESQGFKAVEVKPVERKLRKGEKTDEQVKYEQDNHEYYKWYDEFEVSIVKAEVRNVLAGKSQVIIRGWQIGKKLHPKFIEPSSAASSNAFANGSTPNELFRMLIPKDTQTQGNIYPYDNWAIEQGIDLNEDINHLLKAK
jgi:hypothetical protein